MITNITGVTPGRLLARESWNITPLDSQIGAWYLRDSSATQLHWFHHFPAHRFVQVLRIGYGSMAGRLLLLLGHVTCDRSPVDGIQLHCVAWRSGNRAIQRISVTKAIPTLFSTENWQIWFWSQNYRVGQIITFGEVFFCVIEIGNSDTWSNSKTAIQTPRENCFCDPKMTAFLQIKLSWTFSNSDLVPIAIQTPVLSPLSCWSFERTSGEAKICLIDYNYLRVAKPTVATGVADATNCDQDDDQAPPQDNWSGQWISVFSTLSYV